MLGALLDAPNAFTSAAPCANFVPAVEPAVSWTGVFHRSTFNATLEYLRGASATEAPTLAHLANGLLESLAAAGFIVRTASAFS